MAGIALPPGINRPQSQLTNRPLIATNSMTALAAKRADTNIIDNGRTRIAFGRAGYTAVQIAFGNFYSASGESIDLDTITVQAALELQSSARNRKFVFNGSRTLTLDPGDLALSDPMAVEVAGGEVAFARTYLTVPAVTNGWPVWRTGRATGDNYVQFTSANNQVYNTGSIVTTGGSVGQGFAPLAVIGVPLLSSAYTHRRAIICDGDSIMAGTGDTADTTSGNIAFTKALLDGEGFQVPYVNQGRASDQASFQVDGATYSRWRKTHLWPYATHYLCNFGTNDIAASRTLQNLQDDVTYLWTRAKKYGLQTAHIKLLPRTVSAGGAAIANFGVGGLRDQFNTWLSTQVGNGLLDAVIDCNPLIESSGTPGTWASASYTADGIHMTAAGYALANQAVQAWVLARVAA